MIVNPITNKCYITAADLARSEMLLANAIKQYKEVERLYNSTVLSKQDERRRVIKIDFNQPHHPAK